MASASHIQSFYADQTILITGACGLIGQVVLEKLLRSCPDVQRIFALIRSKPARAASSQPAASARDRLERLLAGPIFDSISQRQKRKVQAIEGDLSRDQLAISAAALDELLRAKPTVVLHIAANVKFVCRLGQAVRDNLKGTANLLNLIRDTKWRDHLKSFVYVSTAYSNCSLDLKIHRDEHIYPSNIEPEMLIKLVDSLDDQSTGWMLDALERHLLGDQPNTYTYTKQLAERLCHNYMQRHRLPVVVCRPTVVLSGWREPTPGFVDGVVAYLGLCWRLSTDLLRVAHVRAEFPVDLVPVDVVANCVIALAWFASIYHAHQPQLEAVGGGGGAEEQCVDSEQRDKVRCFHGRVLERVRASSLPPAFANLPVFHVGTSADNPITNGRALELMVEHARNYPTLNRFRYPAVSCSSNRLAYMLRRFLFHDLYGRLLYLYSRFVVGQRREAARRVLNSMQNVNRLNEQLAYFLLRDWLFDSQNRAALMSEFMSAEDRRLFYCDVRQLDWSSYLRDCTLGVRRFIIREPAANLREARRRLQRVYWRNTSLQLALLVLSVLLAFKLCCGGSS